MTPRDQIRLKDAITKGALSQEQLKEAVGRSLHESASENTECPLLDRETRLCPLYKSGARPKICEIFGRGGTPTSPFVLADANARWLSGMDSSIPAIDVLPLSCESCTAKIPADYRYDLDVVEETTRSIEEIKSQPQVGIRQFLIENYR